MSCSVVLCTCNGERFLQEQLESILAQTVLPSELIISDDTSTDSTTKIIEDFIPVASSAGIAVKYIRQSHLLGVTRNFEFAMRRSTKEIVVLSDQDDVWIPGKIERVLREFESPDVVMIASDAELIDENGVSMGDTLFERLKLTAAERRDIVRDDLSAIGPNRNLFTGATMAVRRSTMLAAMPLSPEMHHDDWIGQLSWLSGSCRVIFEPLIKYRLHNENAVGLQDTAVEPLSLSPRRAHLLWQARRLEPICERIISQTINGFLRPERAALRLRQQHHVLTRLSMPTSFFGRVRLVGVQWGRGFYNDFHGGWRSAVADIIRPA
ncbi:glycosyltransferase [Aquilutibacter rugosus]|uniref:glycosyltransferase n=1 Tax=Aquilutibacter rugosus TaxID=3115820 RepID=UPI002F416191